MTCERRASHLLPTRANPDHFDVLLVDGLPDEPLLPLAEVRMAAERLVETCGEPRPNPAYPGSSHG